MSRRIACVGLLTLASLACAPVDTGLSAVGPGADGGPIFTGGGATADAGAPGTDAGVSADAGPPGAGNSDAGTPDAGSTGGVANGCDGIVPTSIPVPAGVTVPHSAGQACFYFTTDQKGDVAGEAHSGGDPAVTLANEQWQVWSPEGSPTGRISAGADLYGEPAGFEGGSRDAAGTSLVKWSETGAEQKRTLLAGPGCSGTAFLSIYNGTLGLGGCDGGPLTGALFDADGNALLTRPLASRKVDAIGLVDLRGRVVVVVPGSAVGLSSPYGARWFDNTLSPLTDWFTLPGSGAHPSLQPLIGGGAAYQIADNWVASLPSGTLGWTAPLSWLAAHPKNDFRIIRAGRGYARVARFGATEAHNKVELYDAAGNHCGTGAFPGEGLVVGHDGTVIASGGDGGCNLSWWSGILR